MLLSVKALNEDITCVDGSGAEHNKVNLRLIDTHDGAPIENYGTQNYLL